MATVFVRTKGNSWLNSSMIESIDSEGYAYIEGGGRYQLIDDWQNPENQIILGSKSH